MNQGPDSRAGRRKYGCGFLLLGYGDIVGAGSVDMAETGSEKGAAGSFHSARRCSAEETKSFYQKDRSFTEIHALVRDSISSPWDRNHRRLAPSEFDMSETTVQVLLGVISDSDSGRISEITGQSGAHAAQRIISSYPPRRAPIVN